MIENHNQCIRFSDSGIYSFFYFSRFFKYYVKTNLNGSC